MDIVLPPFFKPSGPRRLLFVCPLSAAKNHSPANPQKVLATAPHLANFCGISKLAFALPVKS